MVRGCTNAISVLREPGARCLVDQLRALGTQVSERTFDVVHAVGHVVHAGPSGGEEPSDRGVRPQRTQQLDVGGADREQHFLDALIVDAFPVGRFDPEKARVLGDRCFEVSDGEAYVVDVGEFDAHG